jgi:hypothetical protein
MSPSGAVSNRSAKFSSGPDVDVSTLLAATKRSEMFLVVKVPLLLAAPFPAPPTTASNGLAGLIPLYSKTRTSGNNAAEVSDRRRL